MFLDYTTGLVLAGTTILGITAGIVGVFAVLRRHSLLGDAISHASFPGIVGAFLLTHSKHPWVLMMGGALSACIGVVCISAITRYSKIKKDAALGMVLSVFFGAGLVCMTILQKKPVASQAILNKFLFGNASTLLREDISTMIGVSVIIIGCLYLFAKEFTLLAFDKEYAHAIGYRTSLLDSGLVLLLVLAIMVGLHAVGVILMSTMIIAPATAARQWSYRLPGVISIAGVLGASASIIGSVVSSLYDHLPTGPVIVLLLSGIVVFSLICGPRKGVCGTL